MLVLTLRPGEGVAVDDIAIDIGELTAERVRILVTASDGSRVTLVPEDIVFPARVMVWRRLQEQIDVGDDVQIRVVRLQEGRVRIGIEAPRDSRIQKTSFTIDDDPSGLEL